MGSYPHPRTIKPYIYLYIHTHQMLRVTCRLYYGLSFSELNISFTSFSWIAPFLCLKESLFHWGRSIKDINRAVKAVVPPCVKNELTRPCICPSSLRLLSSPVSFSGLFSFKISIFLNPLSFCSLLSRRSDFSVHRRSSREVAVHRDPCHLFQTLPSAEYCSGDLHGQQK